MNFEFEQIDNNHQRAKVFGGWLVKAFESVCHDRAVVGGGLEEGWDWRVAMTFVPDPSHKWSLCKGVALGDGDYSGCDASAGDCPECGE